MNLPLVLIIILSLLASAAGGVFILKQEKEIIIQNIETPGAPTPGVSSSTPGVNPETSLVSTSTEDDLIKQAEALISETKKFIEEEQVKLALINEVQEKSSKIKGIYVGPAWSASNFKELLSQTELNGLVIDVKEAYGANLPISLKTLIPKFHNDGDWVIARIVVFRDSSLIKEKPEWYLASTTETVWQDKAGQYWLDPKNEEVQNYIIEFSKKVIDYGFDELQFDYIRYPDDYGYAAGTEKMEVIGDFFSKISGELKDYKPSIILSVDLFGYVATQFNSYGIGQRLIDAAQNFDYISFMLYPSHFYGGFIMPEDTKRQIPGMHFPYKDDNTTSTDHLVSSNPYEVILRSIFSSLDYLDFYGIKAKIRPWLQDFDIKSDTSRGIFYDAEKVRSGITAAENSGSAGWLLWNPSYIYTKEALKTE